MDLIITSFLLGVGLALGKKIGTKIAGRANILGGLIPAGEETIIEAGGI